MTDAERLAVLEVKMAEVIKGQEKSDEKLDRLLTLRNKGAGVFWLASIIFGTGIIGTIVTFVEWIKGVH